MLIILWLSRKYYEWNDSRLSDQAFFWDELKTKYQSEYAILMNET